MNKYTTTIIQSNIEYLTGIIKREHESINDYEKQIGIIKNRITEYEKQVKELTADLNEKPDEKEKQ